MFDATIAGCALAALLVQTIGTVLLLRRRLGQRERRVLAAQLALIAGIWLLASNRVEGAILLTFGSSHGLTTSDLLALPALGLIPWVLSSPARRTLRRWTSR